MAFIADHRPNFKIFSFINIYSEPLKLRTIQHKLELDAYVKEAHIMLLRHKEVLP